MRTEVPELSIVVPVYNEADGVEAFVARLVPVLESVTGSYEVVFAIDPSDDSTELRIQTLSNLNHRIRGLVFSRRVGQPTAVLAGIESCQGSAAIIMDCDLQDPPELIPQLVSAWRSGSEVVYARRTKRNGETIVKRLVSKIGYTVIDSVSDVKIPRDTGDFRLISRRVINHLTSFPETHGFLRGLIAIIGLKQTEVVYERPARFAGKGHYNRFFGSLKIGMNGLVAFSSSLLNLATLLGFCTAGGTFLFGGFYMLLKLGGVDFPVGNPTIVLTILFVGGLQLICLGIIGQYIGRIYDEVKRRPRYIVDYKIKDGQRV